jgi:hypothetical protein
MSLYCGGLDCHCFKEIIPVVLYLQGEMTDSILIPHIYCYCKFHNEQLHYLYSSPNIIMMIKPRSYIWVGHVACKEEMRYAYKSLVTKPEGKKPLGRTRNRLHDTIKMDPGQRGYEGVDWNHLAWDREQWQALMNIVMNQRGFFDHLSKYYLLKKDSVLQFFK